MLTDEEVAGAVTHAAFMAISLKTRNFRFDREEANGHTDRRIQPPR